MKRAFTLIELLLATLLVSVLTTLTVLTFNAVTRSWQVSTDYMDKFRRTDYALGQVVAALRSMYYPHGGKQDADYGFMLTNNGDGDDPDSSDIIEWSKKGLSLIGNSAAGDTDHRVQLRVYEEGDRVGDLTIERTGLYARVNVNKAIVVRDDDEEDEDFYTFANEDNYAPRLIADGIVGFNCRVMATDEKKSDDGENDKRVFEDEFEASNSVPYKVELTFRVADPEGKSYRSNTAPLMKIVSIPIHKQSLDGATLPSDEAAAASQSGGAKRVAPGKAPAAAPGSAVAPGP